MRVSRTARLSPALKVELSAAIRAAFDLD